jgi:hypothetical protein
MWAMNNIDLPDADSPRPNLANIPSMDDMLALYEKVLSELDSAISTQREFATGSSVSDLTRDRTNNIIDE